MTEIAEIYGPITEDISLAGERLRGLADGHHPLLGDALAYAFETGGKRIRPALVMLCGKLGRYDRDRLVTLAVALEAVHTATLLHDDTIDQALTRRGLKTVSAQWDSKVAILVGDFLFAKSADLATQLDDIRIMELLSQTVMAMSSGELREYSSSQARQIDESDYFQRISAKTASLFSTCCGGAGIVSKQGAEQVEALTSFGTNLGLAFQIADDVLDFVGDEESLGKPAGNDLLQGTITLPAILMAQDLAHDSKLRMDLEAGRNMESVVLAVRESGALEVALQRASEYAAAARAELSIFPAGQAKEALVQLTHRAVERTH